MNIVIHETNNHILEDAMCLVQIWHPEISEAQRTTNPKRLITKLIRERSSILKYTSISLELAIPLFLIYDLKCVLCADTNDILFNPDEISYEMNQNYSEKEDLSIQILFKKLKLIIKENNITDWEKLKYLLPISTIIKKKLVLNYMQLFKFFSWSQKNSDQKIQLFKQMLFEKLNEKDPIFFTKQNVEIFIANEVNYG